MYGPCHPPHLFTVISGVMTSVTLTSGDICSQQRPPALCRSRLQAVWLLLSAKLHPAPGSQKGQQGSSPSSKGCSNGRDDRVHKGHLFFLLAGISTMQSFAGMAYLIIPATLPLCKEDAEAQKGRPTCHAGSG